MRAGVPAAARLFARLVPAADRESIVGDLLEDAEFRSLHGLRRTAWLTTECAAIGAGFSWTRMRHALAAPGVHELAVGFAVEGRRTFHSPGVAAAGLRALVFCGSMATLSFAAAVLVSALLSAAGL